jgi:hypothetical protein
LNTLCKNFFHGDKNDTRRFHLTLENCDTRCDCAAWALDAEIFHREKSIYHMRLLAIASAGAQVRQGARKIVRKEILADLLRSGVSDSVLAYTHN